MTLASKGIEQFRRIGFATAIVGLVLLATNVVGTHTRAYAMGPSGPNPGVVIQLPDLVVVNPHMDYWDGGYHQVATLRNQGNAAAAAFIVELQGRKLWNIAGLAAGQTMSLIFDAPQCEGQFRYTADATKKITELNESNNTLVFFSIC
jgi:hypothetical protein